jgi:hypothetical protein
MRASRNFISITCYIRNFSEQRQFSVYDHSRKAVSYFNQHGSFQKDFDRNSIVVFVPRVGSSNFSTYARFHQYKYWSTILSIASLAVILQAEHAYADDNFERIIRSIERDELSIADFSNFTLTEEQLEQLKGAVTFSPQLKQIIWGTKDENYSGLYSLIEEQLFYHLLDAVKKEKVLDLTYTCLDKKQLQLLRDAVEQSETLGRIKWGAVSKNCEAERQYIGKILEKKALSQLLRAAYSYGILAKKVCDFIMSLSVSPELKKHFKGFCSSPEIIMLFVYMKCRFSLSYRELEEMASIRGVSLDHATIQRWVIKVCAAYRYPY